MPNHAREDRPMLTDERIVELYWSRDERAIEATEAKYGEFLFRIAYNILKDLMDSEECKNDTYLATWNSIPPSRPDAFSAFITRIMKNTATDRYREKRRQKRVPSEMTVSIHELIDVIPDREAPEEWYTAHELGKLINAFLSAQNDRRQYIFVARFYVGDRLESIAKELHLTASTVQREIEKLKCDLKDHLERSGIYV